MPHLRRVLAVVILPVALLDLCLLPAWCEAQQDAFGQVGGNQAVDFARIGQNQTAPIKVNDAIYQAVGFGNTFLVITPDGNVIIDTSGANMAPKHHDLLTKVSDQPVRYIILTHGHGDHTGGVNLWKGDKTEILTQQRFTDFRAYQDRLAAYFARSNAAQFNLDPERLKKLYESPENLVTPTIVFDDHHNFEVGGLHFEVYHTPGETPDVLTVWVPKYKAAFVGDNVYDSFPNIYTLRGTPPRGGSTTWPRSTRCSASSRKSCSPVTACRSSATSSSSSGSRNIATRFNTCTMRPSKV